MRILLRNSFLIALLTVLLPVLATAQGVTTASIFGKLVDASTGEALIGATVQAVHTPSGTTYGNATDVDGFFRIPGMRVGGPYTLTASYVGFESAVKSNVYLNLGQAYEFSPDLGSSAVELEGVTVISSRSDIFSGNATGAETTVTEEQINVLPTVARAVGDYARLTPQATVTEGADGFSISVGGMNNRYNAFYIDGAVSNDVFGLAGSGFNGGQTGVSPISVDAIESFQINIAPFDVRVAGFAGAAISAITRSGTNNVEASAYAFYRNQNTIATELDGAGVAPFTAHTEGFRIGGPIVKDKAFFFINYERQREETPLPFDSGDYVGASSIDQINALAGFLRSEFGYEPGTFTDNNRFLNSDKLTTKFDFNLNNKHKVALRLGYVGADNLEGVQSNPRSINFLNGSERFDAKTYSAALEVNSLLSNTLSNSLTIGFVAQRDDRDPNGDPFPRVFIRDGSGGITFGSEPFSSANLLNQDVFSINNNLEIYKGKHAITVGTNLEFYRAENLFIAFNYGSYNYLSVDDFLNYQTVRPDNFSRNFSLVDRVAGDESQAIAAFNAGTAGLYLQDKYQVNDKLSVTLGLRADLPFYQDTPGNETFNTTTIPLIEAAGYDLQGANVGNFVKPQLLISPRLGFNYDILGDKTAQLRGGLGIFTSRAPLVWVGGAFNNYGQNVGFIQEDATGEFPFFNPDPQGQILPADFDPANRPQSGQIDLFAEDFKLPQFLKANLAIDKKLPFGFIGTIDVLFNKTLQNVAYQNLNIKPSIGNLDGGPDTRALYNRRDLIDRTYGGIYLGYNTTEGYAYNITASLSKPFSNGLFTQFSYSYGDSYAVFDGTSSQNSSQWRGINSINGRNIDQPLTRADFAAGHRFIGTVSYRINGANGWGTTLTLFSETLQGAPYSLLYGNGQNLTNEDSRNRALIYIPADLADINLIDTDELTAAQQWEALDRFLSTNEYTKDNRGKYAERNGAFGPWSTVVDFKFLQDIPLANAGKHKLQLSFDVFNLTNLINKDWGRRTFIPNQYNIIEFEGFQSGTTNVPTFTFDPDVLNEDGEIDPFLDDAGIQSSRWQGQIGIRYIFK